MFFLYKTGSEDCETGTKEGNFKISAQEMKGIGETL
jgi:hypothetical protein